MSNALKHIVALCKRRGFIYPGSEIYGGFANTYSYGPYGVEIKNNIKNLWWKMFVHEREDMIGLDGPILLHPRTWEASGHMQGFNDAMIDCKECKARFRLDHLLEDSLHLPAEGKSLDEMNQMIKDNNIKCPVCGKHNFTQGRYFNLMFQTQMSKTTDKNNDTAFLRPETAQSIFVEFKNIIDTMRVKLPFGIAQIGKAFRNEITPGNFIFRVIEFEQMEIEYFLREKNWQKSFDRWLGDMHTWCEKIGLNKNHLHEKEHAKEELSHYSKRTVDIVYDFPFGRSELYGLAYRTDFDLSQHQKFSNVSQEYLDPITGDKFIPHVIEPTFGVDRTILSILCDSFEEEKLPSGETRIVLHLSTKIAPVKAAVFPLMKKENLQTKAKEIYSLIKHLGNMEYDEGGAIGKRYRRQDELGTPFCITIDYQTLEDQTITLRERDSMQQIRMPIHQLVGSLQEKLG